VDKSILRLIKAAILVFIFLTIPNVVPADDIKSSSVAVASVGPQKDDRDFEKSLSDYTPVSEWLSSVLNWLPPENRNSIATPKEEGLDKGIGESFTSPKEPEPQGMCLKDIPSLYTSPKIDGEGIWVSTGTSDSNNGKPLVYKTVYRPSVEFPNTVVYMAVFDMNRLQVRLYLGKSEPGIYKISAKTQQKEPISKIVAITNAMWMQQHSKGAGAISRGRVIYPMVPGMATLVVYQDDSVDVLEWSDEIPLSCVKDARQLSYLILKDGKVVDKVIKNGKVTDSEIGMGDRLIDKGGTRTMQRPYWFLANRTAFGVRDDGNLVFVMGHHVSTKDLAKALALAGCKRAIHADANIHNVVCNFYFRDENDEIVKRDKLSPDQLEYTLTRYDEGWTKDFFTFFEK